MYRQVTKNQVLNAILFLYKQVPGIGVVWLEDVARANKPERLCVVLTADQVTMVFSHLDRTGSLADICFRDALDGMP